jgi:hypothetical protein
MSHPTFARLAPLVFGCLALFGCGDEVTSTATGAGGAGATSSSAATGAGGDSASATSSTSTSASTGSGFVPGDPITAENEQWTWIPIEGAVCGNGSPTGIGVNLSDKSKNVAIYMNGGGACWDNLTCYIAKTAVNMESGYDDGAFQSDVANTLQTSLFDRNDPNNPFKDWSLIWVPYCTGDVHSGDHLTTYGGIETHHAGGKNFELALSRIVPTFPNAERIVLSGSSAGGFGAGFNFGRTQDAFGSVRVDLIDDCGPPLPAPFMKEELEQDWRAAWGLDARLPADCPECLNDLDAIFTHYAGKYPASRAALLSYMNDEVISFFFQLSGSEVAAGLDALATSRIDPTTSMKYFFKNGSTHCLLPDPYQKSENGLVLMDWLGAMLADDPSWQSDHP